MAKDIKLSVEEMEKAGVNFGHKVSKLHPKMKEYVSGMKNGVHIFDLEKTVYAPRVYELVRAIDYICLNANNLKKAGIYLKAYRQVYPLSDKEFRKGFLYYHMKGIHTFWIEENHYLNNNARTDVFYKNDHEKTIYFSNNFEKLDKFMLIQQRYQNQNTDNNQIGTEIEIEQGFDLTKFIEYIFKEGTKEQKRELIGCLNTTPYLENRLVTTKETEQEIEI